MPASPHTGVGWEGRVKRIKPRNIKFCNCFHIPVIIKQQQSWMERCYVKHYCYCKATARKLGQTFFHSEPNDGEDKVIFYTITCSCFYREYVLDHMHRHSPQPPYYPVCCEVLLSRSFLTLKTGCDRSISIQKAYVFVILLKQFNFLQYFTIISVCEITFILLNSHLSQYSKYASGTVVLLTITECDIHKRCGYRVIGC